MKLTLKDFQEDAVAELRKQASFATNEVTAGGSLQTLVLAAPTGSGKTVIATRWMEILLQGDDAHSPDPNATFLWITDQPELNEQTLRKMEGGSTAFKADDLVTVDAAFDEETFDAAKVYFLNIQKLGKKTGLVRHGDRRAHTIWQTITATAAQRPGSFWVVIDEAHKGMAESSRARADATTIIQKFIKGADGELPAMPLILGISATPERFTTLLSGTSRSQRPVTVDPESVRSSGLLKDAITLYHPTETQPSDMTMLRDAAERLKRYDESWQHYSSMEQAPTVAPILVVQVEDAVGKKLTKTDLEAALGHIEAALGPLPERGVRHAFQESQPVVLKDRRIPYVAPADIQDDPDLRVVFFKRSLTTGWDCPRAEVMMSFRKAVDQTLIAQLVGRMVRTPLARSVSGSDFLNSVCLYLPHYDEAALDRVIESLTDPDPEIGFPTKVQKGEDLVTLKRNGAVAEAFDAAENLPTYRVEKVSSQSNVRRLSRLGRALAWDKLDDRAVTTFVADLVGVLASERQKVEDDPEFKKRVDEAARIDIQAVTVTYGQTQKSKVTAHQLAAVSENVDAAFAQAGRKLGSGLHSAYLQSRAGDAAAPSVPAIKLELYALLQDDDVRKQVEDRAGVLLKNAIDLHKAAIRKLPDERRQLYRSIRLQANTPEPLPWELPECIERAKDGDISVDRHLYVDDAGGFACKLNGWEQEALTQAMSDPNAVAWLRNDPRKEWSLAVPYTYGGQARPTYPDFVVFRRQGSGVIADIIEPHNLAFEDSVAKAKGLATFAQAHGDEFGRIDLLTKFGPGSGYKRLSLNDIDTRQKVLAVDSSDNLKQLFEDA